MSFCPFLALPAKFLKGLRKEEATEGATAKLRCELSKAAPVEWRKGPETLRAGDRVRVKQDGAVCELEIRELTVEDAGEYSCVCGQEKTSAALAVRGKDRAWRVEQRLPVCGLHRVLQLRPVWLQSFMSLRISYILAAGVSTVSHASLR